VTIPEPQTDHSPQGFLRDLVKILPLGLALASTPIIIRLADLQPPWPAGIENASAVLVLLSALLSWRFARDVSDATLKRMLVIAGAGTIVFLIVYLALASLFIVRSTDGAHRVVAGYACTPEASLVYRENCPKLGADALSDATWDPALLWTASSLTVVRVALVTLWMLFTISLMGALGALVAKRAVNRAA